MAGQVSHRENGGISGAFKQGAAARGLVVAVLEAERAAGSEVPGRLPDDRRYAFVARGARDERLPRLEASVAVVQVAIARGDVRRIGDYDFEAAAAKSREPVAFQCFDRHTVP